MNYLKFLPVFIFLLVPRINSDAQEVQYKTLENIPYQSSELMLADAYVTERCLLDIYYPPSVPGFATVVWFHGGGLSGGNKYIPEELMEKGVAVVAVNYRLYPLIKAPVYIEDAAAAVAWILKHIGEYGGDPELVFVSGHSAGGYLASMVGLDKRWLGAHEIDANQIAGLEPHRGENVALVTISIVQQCDVRRPIGVILDRRHLGRHVKLVAPEINDPVALLMTPAAVP